MKTKEEIKCPKCGSRNFAEILYGMPMFDEKLENNIQDGKIVLGGCLIYDGMPLYRCNECKNDFGEWIDVEYRKRVAKDKFDELSLAGKEFDDPEMLDIIEELHRYKD